MDIELTTIELSLLVIAGLASATYAKSEKVPPIWAAVIGIGVAVAIVLLTN